MNNSCYNLIKYSKHKNNTTQKGIMFMYIAHFDSDGKLEPHYLDDHTNETITLVSTFTKSFDPFAIGIISALLHDLGKKSDAFIAYTNDPKRVRGSIKHALGGALVLQERHDSPDLIIRLIRLIIIGHHTGLANYTQLDQKLTNIPTELIGIEKKNTKESKRANQLLDQAMNNLTLNLANTDQYWYFSTLTRFCFSALIDADWLDTEAYFSPKKSQQRMYSPPKIETFINNLNNYMDNLIEFSEPSTLNTARQNIYLSAIEAAKQEYSFFVLHAPTGSGKTLASLAFALHHVKHQKDKKTNKKIIKNIIFALPLTTITEQTSAIYKQILGDEHVLEHHSQVTFSHNNEKTEKKVLAAENWSLPFTVTTTVQLFQSLFSNQPSTIRKIHKIANSIIIIDEYHKLPLHLLKPILLQLKILREHFGVTVLFMSATPLALEQSNLLNNVGSPLEIVPEINETFKKLQRVNYLQINEPLTIHSLIKKLKKHHSVLCIVNTRKQAQKIYKNLQQTDSNWNHIFHLSATMCGHHRLKMINQIQKIDKNESIIVVSTNLVEIGVDLSFSTVFKMSAPLDSIIQAAGRCNRSGDSACGQVYIFDLVDPSYPSPAFRQSTVQTMQFIKQNGIDSLHDPEKCKEYFTKTYENFGEDALDRLQLNGEKLLAFRDISTSFKMIENDYTEPVLCMSYEDFPHDIPMTQTKKWYRKMQKYMISLDKKMIQRKNLTKRNDLYIWNGAYDKNIGFDLFI